MSQLPSSFLTYPSIATLYGSFPSFAFFNILDFLILIATVFVFFGLFTRWAGILFFVFFVIRYSFVFSIGGSSSLFFVPFFCFILSFSNWGKYYSIDALIFSPQRRWSNEFVIVFLMFTLTFSLFLSGIVKIFGGWLNTDVQAMFVYWVSDFYIDRKNSLITPENFQMNSKLFWEAVDYAVVLIECLPFLFFWNRRVLRILLFLFGGFQIGVYLFMDISFSFFPLLYCLFLVDVKQSVLLKKISTVLDRYCKKKYLFRISITFVISLSLLSLCFFGLSASLSSMNSQISVLFLFLSYGLYVFLFFEALIKKYL